MQCWLLVRVGLPALIFRYLRSQGTGDWNKGHSRQMLLLFLRSLEATGGRTLFLPGAAFSSPASRSSSDPRVSQRTLTQAARALTGPLLNNVIVQVENKGMEKFNVFGEDGVVEPDRPGWRPRPSPLPLPLPPPGAVVTKHKLQETGPSLCL